MLSLTAGSPSFLRLNNTLLYVYTHFLYSYICHEQLGSFHILTIVDNATIVDNEHWSTGKYLFKILILIPLDKYKEVRFLGQMIVLIF